MRRLARAATALAFCALARGVWAAPAPYRPDAQVAGVIRIWGQPGMVKLVQAWADGFHRVQPAARVEALLKGSATAIPGLYSGKADIALMGRENDITDDNGFGRVKQYKPTRLELLGGSLGTPGQSPALAVVVRRDNPLSRLTLAQLDALFGCEGRRGLPPIRTWGDLGLTGAWRGRPVRLHAVDAETGTGIFFQNTVLLGSRKMNWAQLTEHRDQTRPNGARYRSGAQIADAVRRDRYALGVASLADPGPGLKVVALGETPAGPFYRPTRETVIGRQYPLARRTYAFIDRKPGAPIDPAVREFLRYALSRDGQDAAARSGGYLPLDTVEADRQLQRVDER